MSAQRTSKRPHHTHEGTFTDDRMSPVYEPDQHVLFLERPEGIRTGRDFVLRHKATGEIRLGFIEDMTPTHWQARQYNPKRIVPLSRNRWEVIWQIRGWVCNEYGAAPPIC